MGLVLVGVMAAHAGNRVGRGGGPWTVAIHIDNFFFL